MMVIQTELPPSRAGSLPLIGDDLALDFANTESGRGFPSHQNHLREAANVVDWLSHAKALPAEEAEWLRSQLVRPRRPCRRSARRKRSRFARRSRRSPRRSGAAREPPEAALADLSALHARCVARAELAPGASRVPLALASSRDAPVEAALGPVALAAVTLFTEGDLARIKRMRRPRLRLAVLRSQQEQPPAVVRNGGLRQSRQAAAAARRGGADA